MNNLKEEVTMTEDGKAVMAAAMTTAMLWVIENPYWYRALTDEDWKNMQRAKEDCKRAGCDSLRHRCT
jgi:hypothetical protein